MEKDWYVVKVVTRCGSTSRFLDLIRLAIDANAYDNGSGEVVLDATMYLAERKAEQDSCALCGENGGRVCDPCFDKL